MPNKEHGDSLVSGGLLRPAVPTSHRLEITNRLIVEERASRVLEIGAGDHSFGRHQMRDAPSVWHSLDFAQPCDFLVDLNDPKLALPIAPGRYDLVIATEVLEHLYWPQKALREIRRVLAVRGALIISVPNICSLSYRVAWMLGRIPSCAASANLPLELGSSAYLTGEGDTIGGHVIDFNVRKICGLLEVCGFRVEVVKGTGLFWKRDRLPPWALPASLASNIVIRARVA